jgi:NhaA family Na+:H+ antiporter
MRQLAEKQLTKLYREFFNSEKAGGVVLVFVTIISLILANSSVGAGYNNLWHYEISGHSLIHWINDGLMTIFFLLIGLELERELYVGELSDLKNALMPVFGAIGGMTIPALIYILLNLGGDSLRGAGIPMATDIAFAIGILSLLGKRIPVSLKVFLTALAVFDDLGAIIIIAVFYTVSLAFMNLLIALGIFLLLIILNRLKVNNMLPYLAGGALMWYFMLNSGVHPTITGVLLAFAIPFRDGGERSPSYRLQHWLHRPVSFFILPLFALANTCIVLGNDWTAGIFHMSSLGIIAGLFIGKPVGILIFSMISVKIGLSSLPSDLKWKHIFGAGIVGGIGFTMSIFITLLAFQDPGVINISKISILLASLAAGIAGFIWLRMTLKLPSEL